MKEYCKAYLLKDMRQFPDWKEKLLDGEVSLTDDTVVYLWDDLTVVINPVVSENGILWDTTTEKWQRFCQTILHFEVPDDLRGVNEKTPEL